ncbi:hypothetical protein BC628DRAFT_1340271 [Trametes gibbosa]|nr:hypothetical protein BC628DRAFT_1340271 [Trametes gibbosa]
MTAHVTPPPHECGAPPRRTQSATSASAARSAWSVCVPALLATAPLTLAPRGLRCTLRGIFRFVQTRQASISGNTPHGIAHEAGIYVLTTNPHTLLQSTFKDLAVQTAIPYLESLFDHEKMKATAEVLEGLDNLDHLDDAPAPRRDSGEEMARCASCSNIFAMHGRVVLLRRVSEGGLEETQARLRRKEGLILSLMRSHTGTVTSVFWGVSASLAAVRYVK